MVLVYARKYLQMKGKSYCVTNKEQHDLSKKFPGSDVVKSLDDLIAYLEAHQEKRPSSATKAKQLIDLWFSGASATR